MKMFDDSKINIFISYSWDDEEHCSWIQELTTELKKLNFNVVIDKTHLLPGAHMFLFMEKAIKGSDIVLIILTKEYARKAMEREGGAGYEFNIINHELYKTITSNEKFIPILREGDLNTSVPDFLKNVMFVDMRDDRYFEIRFTELVDCIKAYGPKTNANIIAFQGDENENRDTISLPKKGVVKMKENSANIYKDMKEMEGVINTKFISYFDEAFNVGDKNEIEFIGDIKIKKDRTNKKKDIISLLNRWETEIIEYNKSFNKIFGPDKLKVYESILDDFKNKQFRNNLWTVSAALRTKDPDLARYKKDFGSAIDEEILETLKSILNSTDQHVNSISKQINYDNIKSIGDLQLEYLEHEEFFMKGIIGFGIRSEILHRKYPEHFPIMTQRSLWGMYFLTSLAPEFITIEEKTRKGIMRVSHNWTYDYARFTFYNNYIYQLLSNKLRQEYNIEMNPELRFGYCNLFLIEISKYHKDDIKELHQWSDIE